ncbi:hypothetical protein EDD16DRAFT_961017 [Pisolithus croceorrhizus]|nr:hypothetical protein EDD16DRAFT_961017 [Pisolithus croceorrhizus]
MSPTNCQISMSEWKLMVEKLVENRFFCDRVLSSSQNMGSLEQLFIANMPLQNHHRLKPSWVWLFFLLGCKSSCTTRQIWAVIPSVELHTPSVDKNPTSLLRLPVHRHQTFPPESMRCSPEAPPTPQGVASPSLVSLLQKINGLSRKKVYGTQTSRQPFCGEEPVEPNTDKPRRLCPFPSFQGDESGLNKSGTGRIRSPERAPSPSDPISPARRSPRHRRGIFPSGMKTIPTLTAPPSTVHGPLPVTSVHPESPAYMSMASSSSSF